MPWKPKHAEARRKKYQDSIDERERRKRQSRDPESNQQYMREYYQKNKSKFNKRTPEENERRNRERRERYAADSAYRQKCKDNAKRSPEKRRQRTIEAYGISVERYGDLLSEANWKCQICGTTHSDTQRKRLHIDHCHQSGRVRGVLCSKCNTGIGQFRDSVELLGNAQVYLLRANSDSADK